MDTRSDGRIPLSLFSAPEALAAWLADGAPAAVLTDAEPASNGGAAATGHFVARAPHRFACACCAGRSPAAIALDRLFQARARGQSAWFERVGVFATSSIGRDQVLAAMTGDVLTLARYRLA